MASIRLITGETKYEQSQRLRNRGYQFIAYTKDGWFFAKGNKAEIRQLLTLADECHEEGRLEGVNQRRAMDEITLTPEETKGLTE